MMPGLRFSTFRLIIPVLLVASQVYFFVRVRGAILASNLSGRKKSSGVVIAGVAVGLLFVMNGYIFAGPFWLSAPLAARAVLCYLPAVWAFGSILSAFLLCVTQLAGGMGRLFHGLYHRLIRQKAASPPVDTYRRRLVQAGIAGLATAPFVLSAYGAVYDGKTYNVREIAVPFGRTMRVVHVSDIHAGAFMTREEIRRYADRVVALRPDLFVLTGDFVSNSIRFLDGCLEEIVRVQARYGTFATLGNHENWFGRSKGLGPIFRKYGVKLLVNAHRVIQTEEGPFAVVGIDDMRTGHPNLEAALRGLNSLVPTLLLSHRPEIFAQAARYAIPLTLAGHWHGGQIRISLGGATISPAHLMTPYPEGLYRNGASRLYVTRGIGTTFTPIRLNCPGEITVINLT
jgi:predicted MPP superfamily phosphohydrolase